MKRGIIFENQKLAIFNINSAALPKTLVDPFTFDLNILQTSKSTFSNENLRTEKKTFKFKFLDVLNFYLNFPFNPLVDLKKEQFRATRVTNSNIAYRQLSNYNNPNKCLSYNPSIRSFEYATCGQDSTTLYTRFAPASINETILGKSNFT